MTVPVGFATLLCLLFSFPPFLVLGKMLRLLTVQTETLIVIDSRMKNKMYRLSTVPCSTAGTIKLPMEEGVREKI